MAIAAAPVKVYDGTTAALLAPENYTLTGFIAGQGATVTQTAGVYDAADAGSRGIRALLGVADYRAVTGTNLGNYVLPSSALGLGVINGRQLSAVITGTPTKMSDGTLLATLLSGNYVLSGFLPGQGATVTQVIGSYDAADAGSRLITASLSLGNFVASAGTLFSNYVLPIAAIGPGLIKPAILTSAPTFAQAVSANLAVRNLAPPANIASITAQALFVAAVPRTYIPYPAPSTLSTWQNNGFGSLPSIVDLNIGATRVSDTGDRAVNTGPPVINSTEQILLQGGKDKSWHIELPGISGQAASKESSH